jgi:hypothetical protein
VSERIQRLVFGEVAEVYDRTRPGYPAELVDAVMDTGALGPGDRAVEFGAGTGKASTAFAGRGLALTCLEPDPQMAAVARRRLAPHASCVVLDCDLEHWVVEPAAFRLVFAAQAWHWLTPGLRVERAHAALGRGGILAWFWNRPRWRDEGLRLALDDVYREIAPDLDAREPGSHPERATLDADQIAEVEAHGGFDPVREYEFSSTRAMGSDEYADLLTTQSDHRLLEPERLASLLAAVRGTIDDAGGVIEIPMVASLKTTRRAD